MRKNPIHNNQQGQVAFEFILVVSFALGTIFLFFQQSFTAADGYLVHYANFMASRTYLTSEIGSNSIESALEYGAETAEEVYNSYPLKSFNINTEFEVISFNRGSGLFSGTTAKFEKETSFFVGIGGGDKANLISESLLGKEPVRKTCFELTCEAISGNRTLCETSAGTMDVTLYDNGC